MIPIHLSTKIQGFQILFFLLPHPSQYQSKTNPKQKRKKKNRRNRLQRTKVSENIKLHKKPTANDICAPNIINNATDERFELRFTKRENGDH